MSLTTARRFVLQDILKSKDKRLPRLPWSPLLPLVQKMLERQRRLNYRGLFERFVVQNEGGEEDDVIPTQDLIAEMTKKTTATLAPVPYSRVIAFLKAVVLRIIPKALMGTGKKGRRHLLRKIGMTVCAKRGDTLSVDDDLLCGCPPHASLPHRRDLRKLYRFIFQDVVCASIHAFFYVTESAEDADTVSGVVLPFLTD